MIIRKEEPKDFLKVYELVRDAFLTTGYSDGSEADRVNENRNKAYFIPDLTFVAEIEGKIVGYISLHEMEIKYKNHVDRQVEVAPLAIAPEYFKKGIGTKLIEYAHIKAKELGYKAVFLLGNPAYYPRFGYEPTYKYHIYHVNDKDKCASSCMVKQLEENYLKDIEGYIDIE